MEAETRKLGLFEKQKPDYERQISIPDQNSLKLNQPYYEIYKKHEKVISDPFKAKQVEEYWKKSEMIQQNINKVKH